MKKYEVVLEGVFCKEIVVEASSQEEAEKLAQNKLDLSLGLDKEDYTVDSVSISDR